VSLSVILLALPPSPLRAVLRNMSNGYKHQRASQDSEAAAAAPKRRRTPSAGVSPAVEGVAAPIARRISDAAEGGGGGDERNVVELETDADGMDDGYRWGAAGGTNSLVCWAWPVDSACLVAVSAAAFPAAPSAWH
jgi:hypothetical protein